MSKQIVGLVVLLIFSLSFPIFASAHSQMIKSNPSENEILQTVPTTVSITFNKPIQASFYSLSVYNGSGNRVDAGKSIVKKNRLVNTLPSNLENGTYSIKWKIVSNDGHPNEGLLFFQIEVKQPKKEILLMKKKMIEEKKEIVVKEQQNDHVVTDKNFKDDIGIWQTLIQSIFYICLSINIGVLFFYLKLLRKDYSSLINRKSYQLIWLANGGLILSTLLSLPLQVLNISNSLNISSISKVLTSTTFGTIWIIEIVLLILLLMTTYLNKISKVRFLTHFSFIFLLALMLAKSFIGHTMIASVPAAAIAMNFLHLLAMSLWLGGLLAILILLPNIVKTIHLTERKAFYWQVLQSFSSWAIFFVSVLLTSGILSSLLHIDSVNSLISTLYGQVLLSKIGLMFLMILFGVFHFFKTKRKKGQIGKSIWIELSLGIIVLVLAAILTHLPTASFL